MGENTAMSNEIRQRGRKGCKMGEVKGEYDGWATVVVAAQVCRCSNSKALMASSNRLLATCRTHFEGRRGKSGKHGSQLFSLTTMSEYDFRPGGSLKLKRTAEGGVVKKWVFIYHLPI